MTFLVCRWKECYLLQRLQQPSAAPSLDNLPSLPLGGSNTVHKGTPLLALLGDQKHSASTSIGFSSVHLRTRFQLI